MGFIESDYNQLATKFKHLFELLSSFAARRRAPTQKMDLIFW